MTEQQATLPVSGFDAGGYFTVECYDRDGNLRWKERTKNSIPNAALNDMLNVYYGGSSQTLSWYMGIIDNAGYSALAAGDTMASHSGWTENQNYSGGTRPAWTPGAASGQVIQNPSYTTFSMTPVSPITIRGFFLTSSNTLGGTSGTLAATAALGTLQQAGNGDTLKVTYSVSASPN